MLRFLVCSVSLMIGMIGSPGVLARPCYPSDPTDNNPENLCPVFPPPGVNPNSFVQGDARPVRALPTVPNPSGRILIDPRGGFWSGVQTQGATRELETSRNQRYIIRK